MTDLKTKKAVKGQRRDTAGNSSGFNLNSSLKSHPWLTALVTLLVLGGIILLYIFLPAFANKTQEENIIKIPACASEQNVRDTLAKYYGDKFASKVILLSKIRGSDFSRRHGAYMVDSGMSPFFVERHLTSGAQLPVRITINSVRGLNTLASRISSRLDFSPDSLIYALADSTMIKYSLIPENALALFIDDSYDFYWSASPQDVIEKIGNNYSHIWNEKRIEKAKALGLSPAEVIIIASIADEESNKQDEKGKIARLYINRLNKGMKLQADPTVKFALGDFGLRRIRANHLQVESPYNTYKHIGLPPGPIRTVTVKDIDAVLDSSPHDFLYMCAKEDFSGYHSFAKDYATHMQNARNYQKALNRRGIK